MASLKKVMSKTGGVKQPLDWFERTYGINSASHDDCATCTDADVKGDKQDEDKETFYRYHKEVLMNDKLVAKEDIPSLLDVFWQTELDRRAKKSKEPTTPAKVTSPTSDTSGIPRHLTKKQKTEPVQSASPVDTVDKLSFIDSPMEWPIKLLKNCCEESGIDYNEMSKKQMVSALATFFAHTIV
jgi:hypothetical protein